jgi:VWFA-related protein
VNKLILSLFVTASCCPPLALAQSTGAPQGVTLREATITLDVAVSDKAGKLVSGLDMKDFTLLDNNQPVKILSFHATDRAPDANSHGADTPVEAVLVLDTVNLDFKYVSSERQEIEKYLLSNGGRLAQPVSLYVYTEQGLDSSGAPTTDGAALAAVVGQLDNKVRMSSLSQGVNGAIDRFYKSIKTLGAIAQHEALRPGKKLLIWVGPGWPMLDSVSVDIPESAQRENFGSIVALSGLLREGRISAYSISNTAGGATPALYRDFLKGAKSAGKSSPANLGLKVLAVQSGGRVLGPDNDLAAQIDSCVQDAQSFYTLSFVPPRADRINEYHDLKVLVATPGLTPRTNTGYYDQP